MVKRHTQLHDPELQDAVERLEQLVLLPQYLTYWVLSVVWLMAAPAVKLDSVSFMRRPIVLQHVVTLVTAFAVPGSGLHVTVVITVLLILLVVSDASEEPLQSWGPSWLSAPSLEPKQLQHAEPIKPRVACDAESSVAESNVCVRPARLQRLQPQEDGPQKVVKEAAEVEQSALSALTLEPWRELQLTAQVRTLMVPLLAVLLVMIRLPLGIECRGLLQHSSEWAHLEQRGSTLRKVKSRGRRCRHLGPQKNRWWDASADKEKNIQAEHRGSTSPSSGLVNTGSGFLNHA